MTGIKKLYDINHTNSNWWNTVCTVY